MEAEDADALAPLLTPAWPTQPATGQASRARVDPGTHSADLYCRSRSADPSSHPGHTPADLLRQRRVARELCRLASLSVRTRRSAGHPTPDLRRRSRSGRRRPSASASHRREGKQRRNLPWAGSERQQARHASSSPFL